MVLVGHSERRTVFGDTPTKFSAQIADALTKEMLVTYCIGENESEAAGGETNRVLGRQIAEVFNPLMTSAHRAHAARSGS